MYNFKILLKNNYNLLIGRLFGKKKNVSSVSATFLLILGILGLIALYTLQAYGMYKDFAEMNLEKVAIFHAILTSLSVVLIIGIMRYSANAKNDDTDFLLSLPIKKRDIILSKTLNKYIFDFFFVFLLFAPYFVLYFVFCGFNLSVLILGILYMFLLPLLSVGISYICNFVISRLYNRLKLGNLLKSFTLILLFVLVMALMLTKTFTYGNIDITNLDAYFADRPICNIILQYLFSPNIWNILFVVCGTVLPFVLGLVLYSLNYGKTFSRYSSNSKILKFGDGKSALKMLYKKELYSYASTPAYIINTIIGAICILVISVFICTLGYDGICSYLGFPIQKSYLVFILVMAYGFMLATAPISASSISLEGKNIWLLKSSPINEKTLFMSKVLVHLSILEPCVLAGGIMLCISLKLSFLASLTVFVVPTLINLILAFVGILINLWQPKLDFEDESKVVKQSLSVLLTMVLGMVLSFLPYIISLLFKTLSYGNLIIASCVIYIILLICIISCLFTWGVKKFKKL